MCACDVTPVCVHNKHPNIRAGCIPTWPRFENYLIRHNFMRLRLKGSHRAYKGLWRISASRGYYTYLAVWKTEGGGTYIWHLTCVNMTWGRIHVQTSWVGHNFTRYIFLFIWSHVLPDDYNSKFKIRNPWTYNNFKCFKHIPAFEGLGQVFIAWCGLD